MGNTSPKDMDALLPLMNMVIYSIDKVKKLRLNREVRTVHPLLQCTNVLASFCNHSCMFRANRKLIKTVPVWKRTS